MQAIFTTNDVANMIGAAQWQVRRLYENKVLPEPRRFAGKRAINLEEIPRIQAAIRAKGWIKSPAPGA